MTPVDILFKEYSDIISYLNENSQPSFSSDLDRYFKKVLILSSASYFEFEIQEILIDFAGKSSNSDTKMISFMKKKAIGMQYHTFFTWGEKNEPGKPGKNANTFFSLFGEDFKNECDKEVKANIRLDASIKAFLEIGHLRNILVHNNFAVVNIENKTTEEIKTLFEASLSFLLFLKAKLIWKNPIQLSVGYKIKNRK